MLLLLHIVSALDFHENQVEKTNDNKKIYTPQIHFQMRGAYKFSRVDYDATK